MSISKVFMDFPDLILQISGFCEKIVHQLEYIEKCCTIVMLALKEIGVSSVTLEQVISFCFSPLLLHCASVELKLMSTNCLNSLGWKLFARRTICLRTSL